jgi:hypothetical protein
MYRLCNTPCPICSLSFSMPQLLHAPDRGKSASLVGTSCPLLPVHTERPHLWQHRLQGEGVKVLL